MDEPLHEGAKRQYQSFMVVLTNFAFLGAFFCDRHNTELHSITRLLLCIRENWWVSDLSQLTDNQALWGTSSFDCFKSKVTPIFLVCFVDTVEENLSERIRSYLVDRFDYSIVFDRESYTVEIIRAASCTRHPYLNEGRSVETFSFAVRPTDFDKEKSLEKICWKIHCTGVHSFFNPKINSPAISIMAKL